MIASIVIRTLNEARHLDDLLVMIARQKTDFDVETVLIDSGSTDGTLKIAENHGCRITHITKAEFSFGRSLNWGCDHATGDMLILISGHCVPTDEHWLQNLCQPLIDGTVSYTYGRQIGDDDSYYSERRIFAKYFPDTSQVPQEGFFCNNANSAVLRSAWENYRFDEELTGLEDMELAKRMTADGHKVGYVAEAPVFHHHSETWQSVRRRFEREAIALRDIMPEVHLSRLDVLRCVVSSTFGDWRSAARNGITSTSRIDMLRYRWNQYVGSYKGNHEHRLLSQDLKQQYFYPQVIEKADKDEWLQPLYRTPPHESKQPEG
ncbi:glycosyltransferase [Shimia marina]|uniref:Putative glucosyl-3-phosphoglycerate synthase n=1 Tax=Shimia marina TaxID=321267 RepID=A0A0P1F963_9RHOB|nr:glycosyltransferase family 2 protein [Shimia marina]CUH51518.1 putative glucosyl-3-phosphoglycerate synthase [Shimia marina]SFD47159.1 Glycosyl transferase family 2 [Shimia marina]